MLNRIVRFSLSNRLLIVVLALVAVVAGFWRAARTPIDVLPNLNRPRVTAMTECPGLAPEEVESLVTLPLETALVGTTDVVSVRSSSGVGLSTIVVEFDWNADIYRCRQVVSERLQVAAKDLPSDVVPQLTPISSVLGQIVVLAVYSENGETSPKDLRTVADWDVRRKLLALKGVSEIFAMGGERRQFQALVRPDDLLRFGLTFEDVEDALRKSNRNVTGGFLTEQGPKRLLVRSLGRIETLDDLKNLVVKKTSDPPVVLSQVADVREGAAVAVGDGSAAFRLPDGTIREGDAVVLTVCKQPSQDARELTDAVLAEARALESRLREEYPDLRIVPIYQQRSFVDLATTNVLNALRDGGLLVALVVFLFLTSLRTTFITLATIPTALACSCLIFAAFGLTINAMTLGGLAVAIGELVDDAIVDVENIYRRLRENAALDRPRPALGVVFRASLEIRTSIVNGTLIVVLVFLPVFCLTGIEGQLFSPLGLAYVVSLTSSLLVSLTLTPVLSSLLLPKAAARFVRRPTEPTAKASGEPSPGVVQRFAQTLAARAIRFGLDRSGVVLGGTVALCAFGAALFTTLDRDFIPPFNEGAIQVDVDLLPGSSLETSAEICERLESRLIRVEGINGVVRKTGRSEMDEHAVPVSTTEFVCSVDSSAGRDFESIVDDVRALIDSSNLPGTITALDQPLQHLINHLRSGTNGKIAIKVSGENLALLRRRVDEIKTLLKDVDDVGSLLATPIQSDLPQVQIRLNRAKLALYGLVPEDVDATIASAMNGTVATTAIQGDRFVDVLARLDDDYRENLDLLRRLPIRLPERESIPASDANDAELRLSGSTTSAATLEETAGCGALSLGFVPLSEVAEIDANALGPGEIARENGRRQVVIQTSPRRRGAVDVKDDIVARLAPRWDELTSDGIDVRVTGLFESERSATRTLLALSALSCLGVFLILYRLFRSANLALQATAIVPPALVGSVVALFVVGQPRTIPALVGMISICGVASRNGILLLEHYLNLVRYEGEGLTKEMILRAGRDRVAPVLMTALTSAIGLLPLAAAPNLPGREILYPIAIVMIGGLATSTALEFFVRPALFWRFGLGAARRVLDAEKKSADVFAETPVDAE